MKEKLNCPRCVETGLRPLESPNGVTFFECPNCLRHYALYAGRTLTDRWLSPISLPLYCTIFSKNPPDDALHAANMFVKQNSPDELEAMITEINEELSNPTQQVQHIHNQSQSEESLRKFLRRFADIVSKELGPSEKPM